MRYFILALFAAFTFSCVSGQKEQTNEIAIPVDFEEEDSFDYMSQLEQEIIGVWSNASMRVHVNSFNNSDTSFIVDITEETWEMKMNIQPIITTINEDGTYMSEFRNSFDSLIYKPEGTWLIDGDTLIMQDHQATYKYQIFLDGDRAEFHSLVDWDNDGETDDEYRGIQHKNW